VIPQSVRRAAHAQEAAARRSADSAAKSAKSFIARQSLQLSALSELSTSAAPLAPRGAEALRALSLGELRTPVERDHHWSVDSDRVTSTAATTLALLNRRYQ
jgi:hypothetical protein